ALNKERRDGPGIGLVRLELLACFHPKDYLPSTLYSIVALPSILKENCEHIFWALRWKECRYPCMSVFIFTFFVQFPKFCSTCLRTDRNPRNPSHTANCGS